MEIIENLQKTSGKKIKKIVEKRHVEDEQDWRDDANLGLAV